MALDNLEFEVEQAYSGPAITLSAEQEAQYERITRNLQEVTSGEILRKVIADGKVPKCYWGRFRISAGIGSADNAGTATTGRRTSLSAVVWEKT
jgi:hypothetical protein